MSKLVYMDNAATTPVSPEAAAVIAKALTEHFGNPSSIYSLGRDSKRILEDCRQRAAAVLGAEPQEIYFTSGGSESDNWALKGVLPFLSKRGKNHIITTAYEHHAILHTCKALEKQGYSVTYLPVSEDGLVSVDAVANAITEKTAIVSIMYANNEIGTVNPIAQIGALCREKGVLFHTDAVQAVGHLPIHVKEQSIDLLSLSAHKFNGPKGTGLLYCRKGIVLANLIEGGAQERSRRAGTESLPAIMGMVTALENAVADLPEETARLTGMRDRLIAELSKIPHCRLNGSAKHRLPGNVNFSFEGIEGEALLLMLDMNGICASSGSACTSGSLDPSHVLLSIGLPHEVAHGSLRLSLGRYNTDEDVDHLVKVLPQVVERLRMMSPVWEEKTKTGNFYFQD